MTMMNKKEFLKRFRADFAFRVRAKMKGIFVVQDNVIFCNPDGTVKAICGDHDKITFAE